MPRELVEHVKTDLEIDEHLPMQERGWSVQARGRAEVVTTRETLDRIHEVADPRPWADGVRSLYLRMRWTELRGRQLGANWDTLSDASVSSGS